METSYNKRYKTDTHKIKRTTMLQLNQIQHIDSQAVLKAVLKNVNAYVLLINSKVEVLFTNYFDLNKNAYLNSDRILKVGDLLRCNNAHTSEGGCGTHHLCSHCSIRQSIEISFDQKHSFSSIEERLQIVLEDGTITACDVNISGKFLQTNNESQLVLTIDRKSVV